MKLKLNTIKTQNMTCDELEDFTQAYIGGVRTSLDEPIGGNDAPYPLDEDKEIPNINITDGVYADTKKRLEEEDITVNLASSAKEYVRILDDAVREILLANVTHAAEGKISIDEAKAPLAIEGNYGGSPQKFAGTNVEDLDCLEYFNMYVATGSTELVNAFQNCAKLKSIRLPYNVLTISGSHGFCFSGCSSLEEIYMNNVTKLGSYVFQNTKIKKIYIRSVESFLNIGDGGYYNASSRPTVGGVASLYLDSDHNTPLGTSTNPLTIPKTITQINSYALYNLKSLTNLQMHSGVTSIGDYAFYGCSGLDGTTLKSILENNTSAQTKLIGTFGETNISGDITIPSNITELGENTFYKCPSIDAINLNDNITALPNNVFRECTSLKTINLGNIITIGNDTFNGCISLKTIGNANNLTSVGARAFYGCTELESLNLPSITFINYQLVYNSGIKSFSSQNATTIYGQSFMNCKNLENVNIPNVVTVTDNGHFNGCSKLKSIDLSKVERISNSMFSHCTSLTYVDASSALTIENSAFQNCTSLTSIDLSNVTSIENSAFINCTSLTSIDLSNVTSIGQSAFQNCTSLSSINLGNALTSIGYVTFAGCTSLESINIPDSVTSIGQEAFANCTSLCITSLPSGLTNISSGAFYRGVTFTDGFKLPDAYKNCIVTSYMGSPFSHAKGYIHMNKIEKLDLYGACSVSDTCIIPNTVKEIVCYQSLDGLGRSSFISKNIIWQDGGIDLTLTNTGQGHISNYTSTDNMLLDLPSTLTITNSTKLWWNSDRYRKYNIFRMSTPPTLSDTIYGQSKTNHTVFVYSSALSSYQNATNWDIYNIKAIGGTEWITAMKDLYSQHEGKCYNRCTNITEDGYTSSYDNKYYPWTDAFVDYDIFGVDRIEL